MICVKVPTAWRELLTALFEPEDLIEVRFLPPGNSRASLFATGPDGVDELEATIRRRNTQQDVYFGVNPRASEARGDANIRIARVLWADFDGCDVETAVERLRSSGLPPPTALVVLVGRVENGLLEELIAQNGPIWLLGRRLAASREAVYHKLATGDSLSPGLRGHLAGRAA